MGERPTKSRFQVTREVRRLTSYSDRNNLAYTLYLLAAFRDPLYRHNSANSLSASGWLVPISRVLIGDAFQRAS
jgi:hypothetical protein